MSLLTENFNLRFSSRQKYPNYRDNCTILFPVVFLICWMPFFTLNMIKIYMLFMDSWSEHYEVGSGSGTGFSVPGSGSMTLPVPLVPGFPYSIH